MTGPMKIERIRTYHLRAELSAAEAFAYSQARVGFRTAMLVEIVADDGRSGWGEAYGPPAPSKTIIDELYAPRLIGRDPMDTTVIWEELYASTRDYGRGGFPVAALSAVDIALWDLKGIALGQPVAQLLGGAFRTQLTAYATGLYRHDVSDHAAALAAEARGHVNDGFRAMKLKVGFGVEEDARNARAVREAITRECRLAVDANHAYDATAAIRLGWTGNISGNFLFFLPLVFIGFHPFAVIGMLGVNLFYQFFIHTELVSRLVHHRDPAAHDALSRLRRDLAALPFHAAAKVEAWGPWADFERVNVGGTENVLQAARAALGRADSRCGTSPIPRTPARSASP